jgi:hypothetical protein
MTARRNSNSFAPRELFTCAQSRLRPAGSVSDWDTMCHSDAVGVDILCDTSGERPFGLGLIQFPPHGEVGLHIHEGSHILVCLDGDALLRVQVNTDTDQPCMATHRISIGQCYSIESMVPHSLHAGSGGVLLIVVGNDYRMAANHDRLEIVNG